MLVLREKKKEIENDSESRKCFKEFSVSQGKNVKISGRPKTITIKTFT